MAGLVAAGVVTASAFAAEKLSITAIMKKSMKGDTSLSKKTINGTATAEEKAQLAAYVKMLTGTKPPKGEQAEWDKKIATLVAAVDDVVAGKEGAVAAYKTAVNCKACHDLHQED